MNFYATKVDGVALVCGLEWRALAGELTGDKEIRAYAKELDSKLYVEAKAEGQPTLCGFLPNEYKPELPRNAHSLPIALAGVPGIAGTCVLVIEEGDQAYIAALLNGMPAPGFDDYGSTADILDSARAFIRLAPSEVTVYGNSQELGAKEMDLATIVKSSTTLKQAKLKALAASPVVRVAMLSVVLLVVGGLGKYGYDHMEALKQDIAARNQNVDPAVTYMNKVKPLFQAAIPAAPSVYALKEMIGPIVVSDGGWDMVGIVCQKAGCTFTWKNVYGTNKTFVVPPQVKNLRYSQKGDAISYDMEFIKPLRKGINIEPVPTLEQIWRDVIGDFQEYTRLGVERNFAAPKVFGIKKGEKAPKKVKIFQEGIYSVSGPWHTLDVIQKLPQATTFESFAIRIEADKRVYFQLTGKYYVQ